MTTEKWNLKGGYFENCNCQILCPCVVPGPPLEPTEGHCDVGFAFHVDQGDYNGVSLDGLDGIMGSTFVILSGEIAAHTPGIMGHGGWTTAFYVDEDHGGPTTINGGAWAEFFRAKLGGLWPPG